MVKTVSTTATVKRRPRRTNATNTTKPWTRFPTSTLTTIATPPIRPLQFALYLAILLFLNSFIGSSATSILKSSIVNDNYPLVGNLLENPNHRGYVFAATNFMPNGNHHQQQLFLPTTDQRPQLILHIEPVYHRSKVHAYGASSEAGKNRSRTYITDDNGYIGIGGFGDGTALCFVVSQTSYHDSSVHWYDHCHTLDDNPESIESLELNLPSLTKRKTITTYGQSPKKGRQALPSFAMANTPISLALSSKLNLETRDGHKYDNHHENINVISDDNGQISVHANTDLKGAVSIGLNAVNSLAADLDLDLGLSENAADNNIEVTLEADCNYSLIIDDHTLHGPKTWTESIGLSNTPMTEKEAAASGWRRTNVDCHDAMFPGWQWENPENPRNYGLVLIYDASGLLIGTRVALPVDLASFEDDYNYDASPYYAKGTYDGEHAYMITIYMDDREDVCEAKTLNKILCDPNFGQEAYIVTKTSEVPLFKSESDALANGWYLQKSIEGKGSFLAPHNYDSTLDINQLPPYLTTYKDSKLVGLTLIHFVSSGVHARLDRTIFEASNPQDLYYNCPDELERKASEQRALKTSFYLAADDPRDFAHKNDGLFYIHVVDDRGHDVQDAHIKIKSSHKPKAARLVTDSKGNAFAVFDRGVEAIEVSLEASSNRIIDGSLWKSKHHHKLHPSSHRQTLKVERITHASVHVDVALKFSPHEFLIWTDTNNDKDDYNDHWTKRLVKNGDQMRIETFTVALDTTQIHIFGHDKSTATMTYHIIEVDPNRKSSHLNIHETIRSQKKSRLKVEEIQSDSGLSGSTASMAIGVFNMKAREVGMSFTSKYEDTVFFDSIDGVLVAWNIYGPEGKRHTPRPASDHAVTPFHETSKLLKTVSIDINVCLRKGDKRGGDNAAEKDAVVEVMLEYEHASQDDSHEIVPVDYRGNVNLKNVPSPEPGESLNVTLISKLGNQMFFPNHNDYHQPISFHYETIDYNDDGPVHISMCHSKETIVVVVTNGVTDWTMEGASVKIHMDGHGTQERFSDQEGAAFFTFKHAKGKERYNIEVNAVSYDPVDLTRFIHDPEGQTEIVHVKLYPTKTINVYVSLDSDHYHKTPAIGATVDWTAENDGGIQGVDGQGIAEIKLSGKSETIFELTAFIPWQSTCGTKYDEDDNHQEKVVYGAARLHDQRFPLDERPPFYSTRRLTLPRIEKIFYELGLAGTFPDKARLHTDLMGHSFVHVEGGVFHDHANFYTKVGAKTAFLLTEEFYTAGVTLTPLTPCMAVDMDVLNSQHDGIKIKHSIRDNTVKVTVKMVNHNYHPYRENVTLHYILGETAFGHNYMEPDREDAEVVFHVPEHLLVHIHPKVEGGHAKPDPDNPNYFIAKDGLVIYLVIGGTRYHKAIVTLVGEKFHVPEDTLVRYVGRDDSGDEEVQGVGFSRGDATLDIDITYDTAYFDFTVGGSDGFDPAYFQPFEYVYNISRHHRDIDWDEPLYIDIPVKTLKNVIVAVKDCFTGELIDTDVLVKFPADAAYPWSWFNRHTMMNRHSGYTDHQGMVFFHLEPDLMIPVEVTAHGYKDYKSYINLASNTTYLVEANLCKYITVSFQLKDKKRANKHVHHATVRVKIDKDHEFEVTTDGDGKGHFGASTDMENLSLEVVDADDTVIDPEFILHDDEDYLKEGEVDIDINERLYSVELATVSCNDFRHYGNVPVLFKIDDHTEFVRSSDEHGFLKLYIREGSKNITAKILSMPDHHKKLESNHHSSLGLMAVEDLPTKFHFNFISLPVLVTMRLFDSHHSQRTVPHATVAVRLNNDGHFFDVTTNNEGKATFNIPTSTYKITLQLLDASDEITDPFFELRDDCSDFLDSTNVDIDILERMYTIDIATASCYDFRHYSDVPVLCSIAYNYEDVDNHRHRSIHEREDSDTRALVLRSKHGYDNEEHLKEYVLVSDKDGIVHLRLHESAANITLTVLEPPPYQPDVVNLGLMAKDDLPDRYDFAFFALPKEIEVDVRDKKTEDKLWGAEVEFKYYEAATDRHRLKRATSNRDGIAMVSMDGCVQFASILVRPPPRQYCDGPPYLQEKRLHQDVMANQDFKIGLREGEDEDVHISIGTDDEMRHIDKMIYTTTHDQRDPHDLHHPDPFYKNWHLSVPKSAEVVNLLTIVRDDGIIGLTRIPLYCVNDHEHVELFRDSKLVKVRIEDENNNAKYGVRVEWQVGLGLGEASLNTNNDGRVSIYAPKGFLLALKAKGHHCHASGVFEIQEDSTITLTC